MAGRANLRPFVLADAPAVNALMRSVWWPERSAEGWRWLAENPALSERPAPLGFVIDRGDGPEGFTGNLIQPFWRGEERAFAAFGHSIVVPPALMGRSRALVRAVIQQADLFAAYTLNANAISHRLYGLFGLERWPVQTHDVKLSWIVDPVAAAQARLLAALERRRGFRGAKGRERLMNSRMGRRTLGRVAPGVEPLDDLGDGSDYAGFWERLRAEGRTLADRAPRTLRWRTTDPDAPRPPILLAHRGADGIDGYLMAMIGKGSEIEAPTLEILDLVALDGEVSVVQALISTALWNARDWGAAKVRLQVVSPRLLEGLGPLAHRARREGGWGHCHVRFTGEWGETARTDWSPTPFDGDYAFCIRPAPQSPRAGVGAAAPTGALSPV